MKCPKCGANMPKGVTQCTECGTKFVAGKYCPHCHAVIPMTATVCPKCQQAVGGGSSLFDSGPRKQSSFRWWRIPIYIVIFVLGVGVGVVSGKGLPTNSSIPASASLVESSEVSTQAAASSSEAQAPTSEYYFKDNVLVAEDVKIEITSWKVIPVGETGNEYGDKPVIAFWYNTTNLSGKDNINPSSAWIAMFTAVQDNDPNMVNELSVGSLPDSAYRETQMSTIKEGGTLDNAIAYELDDETTPVILKATKGILGEPLGEQTFDIAAK